MTAEQTQPHPADKLAASEGGNQGALMSLWTQLSSLAGGLGLFLLGMTMMTDGLKLAAGPALERILAGATRTRWHALGSGMLVTALVQASGAVTVATIGFVNAGLLSLGPALWVVIGANIGTTVTALFAAIGATPNARRAAAAQVVFNVITGVVALALLPWLIGALGAARAALGLPSDPAAKLALFHTIFNVHGVLLMWPLAAPLTRWLQARIGHVAVRMTHAALAGAGPPALARDRAVVMQLNAAVEAFVERMNRSAPVNDWPRYCGCCATTRR